MPSGDKKVAPSVLDERAQRKAEFLAAYAAAPIARGAFSMLAEHSIAQSTFFEWKRDPQFAKDLAEIQEARRSIDLSALHEFAGEAHFQLACRIAQGDMQALNTYYRIIGLLRPDGTSVKVVQVNEADGRHDSGEQDPDSLEALTKERDDIVASLVRRRERLAALAADTGDPGPPPDREGSAS